MNTPPQHVETIRAQTLVSHSSVIHNVQVLHLPGKCITYTIYVP